MQQKYVYSIEHNGNTIYIGSTANLRSRKWKHKSDCFNEKLDCFNFCIYQSIRSFGITEDSFYAELTFTNLGLFSNYLEEEDRLIKELNPVGNTRNAVYNDEKEKEQNKKYYQSKKQKVLEYRQLNKEQIKEMKRQYYQAHKEQIKEKAKEYYHSKVKMQIPY